MTATYTNSPATSTIDQVRFLTKDTVTASAVNSDEELQWLIDSHPNIWLAAAAAADAIAGKYSDAVISKKVGDLQLTYGSAAVGRAGEYRTLARSLRLQAAMRATPFSGGISESGKTAQEADSDWDRPAFTRDTYQGSTGGVWD